MSNTVVLPPVLHVLKDTVVNELAELAIYIGLGERGESESALAQCLFESLEQLPEEIGIPSSLDVIGPEDIDDPVDAALTEGHEYPSPRSLALAEALQISGAGKILKTELRKPYSQGREQQVS